MSRPLARRAAPLLVLLAALVAAGCGGASDAVDGDATASGGGSETSLSLVAYSTPQVVYDQVDRTASELQQLIRQNTR